MGSPQSLIEETLSYFTSPSTHHGETLISVFETHITDMSQSIIGTTSYRRRLPSGTSKTGRRQYRSCDQCRKGKRACDIVLSDESVSTQSAAPCSNCAKTRKSCTLVWLNSAQQSVTKGKERRDSAPDQQQVADLTMGWDPLWGGALTSLNHDLDSDLRNTTNENLDLPLSSPTNTFLGIPQQQSYSTNSTSSESLLDMTFMYGCETGSTGTGISNSGNICSPLAGTHSSFDGSILSQSLTTPGITSFSSTYENTTPPTERSPKRRRSQHSSSPGPGSEHTGGAHSHNGRRNLLLSHTNSPPFNPTAHSSLSLEHRISLGYSKASISSGLVKIYHDSRSFLCLSMPQCRRLSIRGMQFDHRR